MILHYTYVIVLTLSMIGYLESYPASYYIGDLLTVFFVLAGLVTSLIYLFKKKFKCSFDKNYLTSAFSSITAAILILSFFDIRHYWRDEIEDIRQSKMFPPAYACYEQSQTPLPCALKKGIVFFTDEHLSELYRIPTFLTFYFSIFNLCLLLLRLKVNPFLCFVGPIIFALNPVSVQYSSEIRPYSVGLYFLTCLFLCIQNYYSEKSRFNFYILIICIALFLQSLGLQPFVLASIILPVGLYFLRTFFSVSIKHIILIVIILLISFSPVIESISHHHTAQDPFRQSSIEYSHFLKYSKNLKNIVFSHIPTDMLYLLSLTALILLTIKKANLYYKFTLSVVVLSFFLTAGIFTYAIVEVKATSKYLFLTLPFLFSFLIILFDQIISMNKKIIWKFFVCISFVLFTTYVNIHKSFSYESLYSHSDKKSAGEYLSQIMTAQDEVGIICLTREKYFCFTSGQDAASEMYFKPAMKFSTTGASPSTLSLHTFSKILTAKPNSKFYLILETSTKHVRIPKELFKISCASIKSIGSTYVLILDGNCNQIRNIYAEVIRALPKNIMNESYLNLRQQESLISERYDLFLYWSNKYYFKRGGQLSWTRFPHNKITAETQIIYNLYKN